MAKNKKYNFEWIIEANDLEDVERYNITEEFSKRFPKLTKRIEQSVTKIMTEIHDEVHKP